MLADAPAGTGPGTPSLVPGPPAPTIGAAAAQIAPQLFAKAELLDQDPDLLGENYELLKRTGYLRGPAPSELGGLGASLAEVAGAQRMLAAACPSTALAVNMHLFQVGALADRWWEDRTGEPLLTAVVMADKVLASTAGEAVVDEPWTTPTVAVRSGDGYSITGEKYSCSQADVMDLVRIAAMDKTTGQIIMLMVPADAPGLQVVRTRRTLGMRGSQTYDVVLDNVAVGQDAVTMRLEGSLPLRDRRFAAGVAWFLATLAGVYAGVADRARVEAHAGGRGRDGIGRVELLHRRVDAMLWHGLAQVRPREEPVTAMRNAVALKENIIGTAEAVVETAVEVVGSRAYSAPSPLERLVRDMRAGRHHPPSTKTAMRLIAGGGLTGR